MDQAKNIAATRGKNAAIGYLTNALGFTPNTAVINAILASDRGQEFTGDAFNMLGDFSDALGISGIYNYGVNLFDNPLKLPIINRQRDEIPLPLTPIQPTVDTTGGTGGGGGADSSRTDFPIIGGNQGGNQGGGGTVIIGGQPGGQPSTDPVQETNRIRDIMKARAQGANIGFNAGGLATIPRYLKGR